MKKVAFLFDVEWAFGSVHYELFKYLWTVGYNCHLLTWAKSYTIEEMQELDKHIDFWVTTPEGCKFLENVYGISVERCVGIAHAKFDLEKFISKYDINDFNRFRNFGVVSSFLKDMSKELGIQREPIVCSVSINYHTYYGEPSKELKVIGYAGTYWERDSEMSKILESNFNKSMIQPGYKKRGYLIRECAEKAGLIFKVAQLYHNTFVTMSGFYKTVDAVGIASLEEGAGLPSMEAGAAGKLVIGTPVGLWPTRVGDLGGITVPIPEKEFVEQTVDILMYYKDRPREYQDKCYQIREHAKSYDWVNSLPEWISVFR